MSEFEENFGSPGFEEVQNCGWCGHPIKQRNASSDCDHLYWPDNLTPEAKIANGYRLELVNQWVKRGDDNEVINF